MKNDLKDQKQENKSVVSLVFHLSLIGASAAYLLTRDIVKEKVCDFLIKTGKAR
jgi:hypothetical protein